MTEREVQIPTHNATLAGSYIAPAEDPRVVLMIHGSGPIDRNENMHGQGLNVFNTIAERLAQHGAGSLRYDKRGCAKSTGDHLRAGHLDTVDDAAACIDYLINTESIPEERIVVLGHSEGTIIAAELAPRYPNLAGLILLCPFIQPMEVILLNQAKHMADAAKKLRGIKGLVIRAIFALGGGAVAGQQRLIQRLRTTTKPTFRFMLRRIPAQNLRELLDLDFEAVYRNVTVPTLIIAGEKDVQCDPNDVPNIEACIQADVEAHVIKDLTHILRRDKGEPSIFRYTMFMREPVDEAVLDLIQDGTGSGA
jgi:uncharacterized protein